MSETLVRVQDISFAYTADADTQLPPALQDVSLDIHAGELVALIGQNGSGKTTLAKHLNGLLKPATGRVLVGETDTREIAVGKLARRVGFVFQNPDHQLFLPSVRREVEYGPRQLGIDGPELDGRVAETLARFGLTALADAHPAMLGRGLRRLTALAAVCVMGPRVLVLDEPTGGLDRRRTGELMAMLRGLVDEGRAVALITHEMALVAEHAHRVVALRDGRVVADMPPSSLYERQDLLQAARLQAPDPALLAAELRERGVMLPPGVVTVAGFCDAWIARQGESQ
ncbi:MAG TPA: ABC transporter ATP-binding protein [Thermomicrobiales bacterium]|nr:ABC transporter ATP-binding protein [Thermomicrobiales bacterium]